MSPTQRERRRLAGDQGDGGSLAGSDDGNDRTAPRWTPGAIARERVRARLRHLAAAAGRPLLTLDDEHAHAAGRRVAEAARIRAVGA